MINFCFPVESSSQLALWGHHGMTNMLPATAAFHTKKKYWFCCVILHDCVPRTTWAFNLCVWSAFGKYVGVFASLSLPLSVQIRSLEDASLCNPVNGDIHLFWLEGDTLREGNKKNIFSKLHCYELLICWLLVLESFFWLLGAFWKICLVLLGVESCPWVCLSSFSLAIIRWLF